MARLKWKEGKGQEGLMLVAFFTKWGGYVNGEVCGPIAPCTQWYSGLNSLQYNPYQGVTIKGQ